MVSRTLHMKAESSTTSTRNFFVAALTMDQRTGTTGRAASDPMSCSIAASS
jgi:hypothetical protein